ncbi:hypothetical protein THER_1030 [Thermodesulfovibrio sp. N1]|uniref:Vgb family protein n=1 Tax=Thermodesulfovibrio sp. N1 TaxID=1871110 RepID=UPI00083A9346|nr:hypothetical protein [Thermodesulfovibrio sp. N1]ODA44262.1 hypothetical protein THER_1030 [Thermodesulfovibrio sp. N1]
MFRYLFLLILPFLVIACTEQVKLDVSGVGETMPQSPTAITWDGKNLIVGKEGLIAFIDNIDTATAGSIYNYEGHYFFDRYPITITSRDNPAYITGLAWQKTVGSTGYIWVADSANKRILKVTPQGDVLKKLPLGKIYPEDMTFDGEYLWIADSKREKIFKITPEDGSVIAEYLSPIKLPTAIAWDGKYLIIAGIIDPLNPSSSTDNVRIIRLDTVTGKVIEEIPNSRYLSSPAGMVWIDGKLWISDRNSGYIVRISDWGSPIVDEKTYKLAEVPSTIKKVEIKEKQKADKDVEEAKRAAEEAKKAAEEAKRAAEAAKKAFELQQKK